MSKLLAMMMKPKEYMYATIKGSLTENDGVFSGFSGTNYLALQNNINLSSNFEIKIKFTPSSETTGGKKFLSLFYNNSIYLDFYTSGTTPRLDCQYSGGAYWTSIASNLSYDVPIIITIRGNGTTLNIEVNQNNNLQSGSKTLQELGIENIITNNIYLGRGHTTSLPMINGSIDLNQSYIKIANTKYQLQAVVGYTVVGSPTITDGVVSGFSSSDYLELQNTITLSKNSNIEIIEKINKPSNKNSNSFIGTATRYGFAIQLNNSGKMAVYVGDGNSWIISNIGTFILDNDTDYYIKIKITNGLFNVLYSVDNINYTLDSSLDISSLTTEEQYNLRLGMSRNISNYFNGSIDLNETWIKINNKLWFNGQPA